MKTIGQNDQLFDLFKSVLNDDYISWEINSYQVSEGIESDLAQLKVDLKQSDGKIISLEGSGDGVIDAFFSTLVESFSSEYCSLKTINFADFKVTTNIASKNSFSGSDSEVEVEILIENSYKKQFNFVKSGRSMLSAAMKATLIVTEFFVNSEKAYIVASKSLADSQERHRSDLVQHYQNILIQLVKNTSYSEIIENLKEEQSKK